MTVLNNLTLQTNKQKCTFFFFLIDVFKQRVVYMFVPSKEGRDESRVWNFAHDLAILLLMHCD